MANNKVDRLSQYIDSEPILWNDRKRYLGLPISFTRYSFDQNKFYIKTGFFNNVNNELLLYRVLDIQHKRSLFQKIFGVGSIILVTADKTTPNLEIKNVRDSERVAKALSNIVEKERDEKRVLGKEMFGASGAFDVDMDGGIDHGIDHGI